MFNFKKIASVLASAVMLSSTIGFAAAANYPAPFVSSGTADVAVVWGANAAVSDLTAAIDVQQGLGSLVTSGSVTSSAGVVGEAVRLFSDGKKLYINDSLNSIKSVLTSISLPTILKDGSFSGNVDASIKQKINIGFSPSIQFKRQPTSSDDPNLALTISTSQSKYIYNTTITFGKAVNFSHPDSEGEDLEIFGSIFTVGSATDFDTLVLLRSAEKLSLDSNNPTADVSIDGSIYTIELVSSSDTSATIKVTDSSGKSASKEIKEAASKKVLGITIAVINADETNLKLSASIIAGTDKLVFDDSNTVTSGESDDLIDGTLVDFETGSPDSLTKFTISVYAPESDKDAIKAGESFLDPVFGTFKIDFSGFNINVDDISTREDIVFTASGDDRLEIKFTNYENIEKTIQWAHNSSDIILGDDDFKNITVFEEAKFHFQEFVMIGNEETGQLLRLIAVKNATTGTTSDIVKFQDVFSGQTYTTSWATDGVGTIEIGGNSYDVTLEGISSLSTETYNVSLNYPDSSGTGVAVIYPTIETRKGANIAFYEPITITNMSIWDDTNPLTEIKFPDGDGYTSISSIVRTATVGGTWNFTAAGTVNQINTSLTTDSFVFTSGQLTYNISNTALDDLKINLQTVNGVDITQPAVVIFEEQDDNNNYEAIIVEIKTGGTSTNGLGIDTVEDTWSNALGSWSSTRRSDSKKEDRMDLWGTLITIDSSDSDQKTATINYPDEQIYAQIYVAEIGAAITPGQTSGGGGGQVLIVKDSEVSAVAGKNLIVIGGSCINIAAAKILDSDVPLCTSDFTAKTGVGVGQYIIKTVTSPYSDDKVAMLVAGYEAADTVNAVRKAMEGVMSDAGTEQVYPITTTAT